MSSFVEWSEEEQQPQKKSTGSSFLKLEAGKRYTVRLVGKAYKYFQHWEPVVCRSPGTDPETGQVLDPLMQAGLEPKLRYSIWVLDRNDGNKLKLMDFPSTLFKTFLEWKEAYNEDPGGIQGTDWNIKLEVPAGGNKKNTKYSAFPLKQTPFTPEEAELIKKMQIREKIVELRGPHSPEEIRAMIAAKKNGTPMPGKNNQQQQSQAPVAQAAPVKPQQKPAVQPISGDDIGF